MYAVIMAGGSGTRFWPASRREKPKQFLDITGRGPMLVETCNRLGGMVSDEEMIVVLGREHEREARAILRDRGIHLVAEPVGRNTAPCIGLGALYARHLGCDGPVAFLPADHYIGDRSAFLKALRRAGDTARSGGIVTLGIVPTCPETGYGYIQAHGAGKGEGDAAAVSAFVEKPDLETARTYLASGAYYWNAGIFVATPDTLMAEFRSHLPELHEGLQVLEKSLGTPDFDVVLKSVYKDLASVSFDYGIMEKTTTAVFVVPCECGWSDVGSWRSLYDLRAAACDGNRNLSDGETLFVDCENSFVSGRSTRLVACLGLTNCLIVDTADALLVADLNRSQDVRRIVEQLKKEGRDELL
jgi:mannose-1-phosphate guanylyltransferase/mannose-6-phosphate isomerase